MKAWYFPLTALALVLALTARIVDATARHADSLVNCREMCGGAPVRFLEPRRDYRAECICAETDGGR